jgi:hypothetical protein
MTTIDLIDSFCRQSIIGIDPIDVFLTIGAQLCSTAASAAFVLRMTLNFKLCDICFHICIIHF